MNKKELEQYRKLEDKALEFARNNDNELMSLEIKFPKKCLLRVLKFLEHLDD